MAEFLASHWENGWAVTEIKGALDTTVTRELCDFVTRAAEHRQVLHLIVDLSDATDAGTEGVEPLMSLRSLLSEGRAELRLVCQGGPVKRTLSNSGLARLIPVYPSVDAALAALRTTPVDRMGGAAP